MSGSDDTEGNDIEQSKENENGASSNNKPSQRRGVESQGNCQTNSVVQVSGTSATRRSSSEIPQSFPTTTENTSSNANSLQSKQLEPQPVSKQIPAEENRSLVSDESAQGDDPSSRKSAPDADASLDSLASHEDRISDGSSKDCEEELPCHLQQQPTFNLDGTLTGVIFHNQLYIYLIHALSYKPHHLQLKFCRNSRVMTNRISKVTLLTRILLQVSKFDLLF